MIPTHCTHFQFGYDVAKVMNEEQYFSLLTVCFIVSHSRHTAVAHRTADHHGTITDIHSLVPVASGQL
jgi:hypothetical protein